MSTRTKERVQTLGEVFTASAEVNLMLDMLAGAAENPGVRILEPSCGNGNFLVEIAVRRSGASTPADAIRNVFGVEICGDNVLEARERVRSALAEAYAPEMMLAHRDEIEALLISNIRQGDFLTMSDQELACDVIVGNPPYQEMDEGFGSSARPIYQKFLLRSKALARKVCLIIPARWYTGGKGLGEFRKAMLADRSIARIVDWENSSIPFPGVDISGGICVVLMNSSHNGDCLFEQRARTGTKDGLRDLRENEVLIRDMMGADIARKAMDSRTALSTVIRPRNAFGMATNFRPAGTGDVRVLTNAGWDQHPRNMIEKRADLIDKWKVFVSGSAFEHAGSAGKDGKRRVLSRIIVAPPGSAATETYILIEAFDDEQRARRLAQYLSTKTVRYLISLAATSHHITRDRFRFVPIMDFDANWDDGTLAEVMGLDAEERSAVDQAIRAWPNAEP